MLCAQTLSFALLIHMLTGLKQHLPGTQKELLLAKATPAQPNSAQVAYLSAPPVSLRM